MASQPEWITDCDEYCRIIHDDELHVMWNFVEHLGIRKDYRVFLHRDDKIPLLRMACFVHWLIAHIDLEKVNIIVWA